MLFELVFLLRMSQNKSFGGQNGVVEKLTTGNRYATHHGFLVYPFPSMTRSSVELVLDHLGHRSILRMSSFKASAKTRTILLVHGKDNDPMF